MALYDLDGERPILPADGSAFVAPSADVIGAVTLKAETSVWFGVVIRGDGAAITVGARSNIQDGAVLHVDPGYPLSIGEECTIGHRAILHGCTIGRRVLIGMGATVLNGAVIGDDCLVGAGALVTEGKHFPPGSLIVGAPAKLLRPLDEAMLASLRASAEAYVAKSRRYRLGLTEAVTR